MTTGVAQAYWGSGSAGDVDMTKSCRNLSVFPSHRGQVEGNVVPMATWHAQVDTGPHSCSSVPLEAGVSETGLEAEGLVHGEGDKLETFCFALTPFQFLSQSLHKISK